MISRLLLHLLLIKNKENATNNGLSPTIMAIITIVLWAGMGFIGYLVGQFLGGPYAPYICMIVFVALGAYISHVIASHSFVDYTPRKKISVQAESYVSSDYFNPRARIEPIFAQITISLKSGSSIRPAVWEFFLNGRKVGEIKDDSPITFPTGSMSNVLVARDGTGILTPRFEFTVKSGRHSKVLFSEGRFEGAKDIGRMTLNMPEQPDSERHTVR